jgi:internalin A
MSEFALQLIAENKKTRATRLDLGYCGLTELPLEALECVWVEELILSRKWHDYYFIRKGWSPKISLNKGKSNKITFLPPNLHNLPLLKNLVISDNQIIDLSPIASLANLQNLYCNNNNITDLSPIASLANLQNLYCINNNITDLFPISSLTNLQILYCSYNQIADLAPIAQLTSLQQLHCSYNLIANLAYIVQLTNLKQLNCDSNLIADLAPIAKLNNLEILNCGKNKIADLTPIAQLANLKLLDCYSNQIADLAPIAQLTNLQQLNCHSNQIADLTPIAQLTNLKQLDCQSNQIADLTPIIGLINKGKQVKWLRFQGDISVEGNPLTNPPIEIVEQGNEAILNYWQQIEEQGGTQTINEAKLIIVGEGKSGKTTLFHKLIDPAYTLKPLDETHGINIHEGLVMEDGFRANLWDFGGQELQYMTHQFFLTPRALYILLMDARAESPNLAYWFKIISLLGRDSDGEKVSLLLVSNKRKGSTGTSAYHEILKHYEKDFDYQALEVDFNENDTRWACLKEMIQHRLSELPIVKNELPKQWNIIREALRAEAKTKNYISTDRLGEICDLHQVNTEQSQFQLTQYLHQLGSLLHFQNDPDLSDTVILSPEWAVEGVYTVLKSELIKEEKKGKFKAEDIFTILKSKNYTHSDCSKILKLMSKNNFDVCYQSENGYYVAAQLLPESHPPQYKWYTQTGALQFRYQYPIMPKGLMSRLIVRMSSDLEEEEGTEIVWKKGAILHIEKDHQICRVMMCEDDAESSSGLREIKIEVMGDLEYRKFALQKVRDEVEKLHQKWFKNIKVDEMVPCICSKCSKSDNPELYKLQKLLKRHINRPDTSCDISGEDLMIQQLLEGVYDKNEITKMDHQRGI